MRPAARASPPGRTTCAFAVYANFNGIGVIGRVKGYNTVREAKKSIVTPALTSATFAVVIMPSLTPLLRRISSNRFDRLNRSMQPGVKSLRWGFECQSLTWPFVELTSDFVEMSLRIHRQVGPLREVLPQQTVGVFIGTAPA